MPSTMSIERAELIWGDTFRRWSKPLSDTEEVKAQNAARIIREAIAAYAPLARRRIDVYPTGSHRNNTNVRGESDIDVAVVCHDTFFWEGPPMLDAQALRIAPAVYSFEEFRGDLGAALSARFRSGMTAGDKAFNVHENTYRLEADVTPFFEYRRFNQSYRYDEGVKSVAQSGSAFVNWHTDHYDEGVKRNQTTGRRFKRVTRILKNVKFDMIEHGIALGRAAAEEIPSFLVECLVFNAEDGYFNPYSDGYVRDLDGVTASLLRRSEPTGDWLDMMEVSRRKSLFEAGQPWTRAAVNTFLLHARRHLFEE
jgi:hypothetical protein